MTPMTHYPFEAIATLRRDVETLTRAWDAGRLSAGDKRMLRFAFDLFQFRGPTPKRVALVLAIVGTLASEHGAQG